MRLRRPLTVSTLAAALLFAAALPAGAHPYFTDGATVPADSLATLTLAMAHGCGTETDEGGDDTTEVSVEVPEAFSYVEPEELEGYEVSTEGDGPVPEVVTWTATDGAVPAPAVTFQAVVDGEPGDELYVRVFQSCDDDAYRWVGTPDEPADDPAVRLTLAEPDPDAPAPPEPDEPEATTEDDEATGDDAAADTDGDEVADAGTDADAVTVEDLPTEPPEEEGDDGIGWLPIVLGAVVLAGLGGLLVSRRRPIEDTTAGDGTGMNPPVDDR